jgi:type II secretory pathway component PulF
MIDTSLNRVFSFNDQLIAFVKLGLPIELGLTGSQSSQIEWLRQTNADLALQTGRGRKLDQLIQEYPCPATYRVALESWLNCDQPTVVFDALVQPRIARRRVGMEVGRILIQPLIVFVLAYIGFVFFCLYLFPRIEGLYAQLWREPSWILSFFGSVRAAMPIWVPLVPLLTIAAVALWMIRSGRQTWRWLPGSERYFQLVRSARLAEQVADLVDQGADTKEAVTLAAAVTDGLQPAPTSPMLHWVIDNDFGRQSPPIFRFVGSLYRGLAWRRSFVWRVVLPTVLGVLIGGLLVLGYGLALFLPMTELLHDISAAGGM